MSNPKHNMNIDPLISDGERFLPEHRGAIRYEHLHRYALCMPFVQGRRVLDAASGEGYGSSLLAARAASVVGVDQSLAAISHARRSYVLSNLQFELGDVTALPIPEASEQDLLVETKSRNDLAYEMFTRARESYEIMRLGGSIGEISLNNFSLDGTAVGYVDSVEDAYFGIGAVPILTVGRRASIIVRGWVLLDGKPAESTVIAVGETVVSFGIPVARPDVGDIFGLDAALCGFRSVVPIDHTPGEYTFDVVALNERSRRGAQLSSFRIFVLDERDPQLSETLYIEPIDMLGERCKIDRICSASDVLRVRGWAFHPHLRKAFDVVAILIDERRIVALKSGLARRDVSASFGLDSFQIGVESNIIAQSLGPGSHELRLIASNVGDSGQTYVSTNAIRFRVDA